MSSTAASRNQPATKVRRRPSGLFVPEYAEATLAADFAWWSEQHLMQTVDQFVGQPLAFEGWQLAIWSEALALDPDEEPYWKLVVLVLPRKNGKTSMLAAYALYSLLEQTGSPEILLAASSDKQAGRLFDAACSFVRVSGYLDSLLHLRDYVGEIVRKDGLGTLYRMASDPKTAHGYNPSLVIGDELAQWTTPTLRRAWGAFATGGGARTKVQRFAISTAGEASERDDSILGQLIDQNERRGEVEKVGDALTISRDHSSRTLAFNFEAPTSDPQDIVALKKANPASWITPRFLREQAESPDLTDAEVLQYHGGVWADGHGTWIPKASWDAAFVPGIEIPEKADIVVGADAAHTRDTTAATITWRAPDGRFVQTARVWACIAEKPHHEFVPGGRLDNDAVRDYIRNVLNRRYRVRLLLYDERYFSDQAAELSDEDDLLVVEMQQGKAEMRTAWTEFYDALHVGDPNQPPDLAHDGDPIYAQHVRNAVGKKRDDGTWHVSKASQQRPIDAVAAGAMSLYGSKHLADFMPRAPVKLVSW